MWERKILAIKLELVQNNDMQWILGAKFPSFK